MGILVKDRDGVPLYTEFKDVESLETGLRDFFERAIGPRQDGRTAVLEFARNKLGIAVSKMYASDDARVNSAKKQNIIGEVKQCQRILSDLERDLRYVAEIVWELGNGKCEEGQSV